MALTGVNGIDGGGREAGAVCCVATAAGVTPRASSAAIAVGEPNKFQATTFLIKLKKFSDCASQQQTTWLITPPARALRALDALQLERRGG
jgi:hypothetical protein